MASRNLWKCPVVQRRLQVGGYARITGSVSATARRFKHDRKTIRDCLHRYQEFEETGDLCVFLNRPRGDSHRTSEGVEKRVVEYYQEEDTRRTCPNIAHALMESERVKLTRQTVYNILRRHKVWVPPRHGGPPVTRFEMSAPNMLWQVDLIELEETCLGKVYALVVIDDRSRYLIALRFFFTKEQEAVLYAGAPILGSALTEAEGHKHVFLVCLPGIHMREDNLEQLAGHQQGEVGSGIHGQLSFRQREGRRSGKEGLQGSRGSAFLEVEAQQGEGDQGEVHQRIRHTGAARGEVIEAPVAGQSHEDLFLGPALAVVGSNGGGLGCDSGGDQALVDSVGDVAIPNQATT